jgi:hypothetical protein
MGAFAEFQPLYAARGVATFPVTIANDDKAPSTRGYMKTGLRGSAQLAMKFVDADSFGFACGKYSRLTIVDMDDTDPAIVREGERLYGVSPLLWVTGGGKYAMAFRHNGEARRIRPMPSLPIDLLGGGFVVAPGSAGTKQRYELIKGSLADLDHLPVARIPSEITAPPPRKIPNGKRHDALFAYCRKIVDHCDNRDQLIDAAKTWSEDRLDPPLLPPDIVKTCYSVWQYRGGRKGLVIPTQIVEGRVFDALVDNAAAIQLYAVLRGANGPDSAFMIADGLGKARGGLSVAYRKAARRCSSWGWSSACVGTATVELHSIGGGMLRLERLPARRRPIFGVVFCRSRGAARFSRLLIIKGPPTTGARGNRRC